MNPREKTLVSSLLLPQGDLRRHVKRFSCRHLSWERVETNKMGRVEGQDLLSPFPTVFLGCEGIWAIIPGSYLLLLQLWRTGHRNVIGQSTSFPYSYNFSKILSECMRHYYQIYISYWTYVVLPRGIVSTLVPVSVGRCGNLPSSSPIVRKWVLWHSPSFHTGVSHTDHWIVSEL